MIIARKRIVTISKTVGAVLAVLFLVAAPVLAQTYTAEISLEETVGTSYTMLPVLMPLDTTTLIADFYLSATGLDSRVTDGATYPHMLANNKLLFGFPLAGNSSNPLEFSAGNAALAAYDILVGWDGYITVTDILALEPGAVFKFDIDGYVNTAAGASKYLFRKFMAVETFISGATDIRASLWTWLRWTTPTGHVAGGWNTPLLAYDDDVATFAWDNLGVGPVWSGFLELSHAAIDVTSVRYYCGGDHVDIDEIDVDLFYDGIWNHLYIGPFVQGVWETKTLALVEEDVTSIRISVKNSDPFAGHQARIFEVDYGEAVNPAVTASGFASHEYVVVVEGGTLLWDTGDALNFDGTITSNINCGVLHNAAPKLWVSFWWRPDALFEAGVVTQYLWAKRIGGGDFLAVFLDGATGSLVLLKADGGPQTFRIDSAETIWAADTWYHVIASISNVNAARFIINGGVPVTDPDVTAVCNGGDFIIGDRTDPGVGIGFEGEIANFVCGTDDLTPDEEDALYAGTAPGDENNLWCIGEGVGTRVIDYGTDDNEGTIDIAPVWESSVRPCWFGISIDGVLQQAYDTYVDIPDNTYDWMINQNNVLPYMTSYEQLVGGVLISHYEPVTYIMGTTLPDRQGVAQNGIITWGSNPIGVSAVMGSLVPTGSFTAADDPLETPDAAGEVAAPAGLMTEDAAMETAWDILFPFIGDTATATDTPQVLLVWFLSGAVIIGLIVVAHRYMQNMWITGLAGLMGVGIGIAMGAFPGWFLIVAVLSVIGIVTLERSPSL